MIFSPQHITWLYIVLCILLHFQGEKYIVLVKQGPEHLQSSVINRKLARPLSIRKEVAKSRPEFYFQGAGVIPEEDDGFRVSPYGSMSTLATHGSSATLDSGISSDAQVSEAHTMLLCCFSLSNVVDWLFTLRSYQQASN